MGNLLAKLKGISKEAAVIEIRSEHGNLLERIVLNPKEAQSTADNLYKLISTRSKRIKKEEYLLLEKETARLYVWDQAHQSKKQVIPFTSQNALDIRGEKCFVVVEKNLPPPKQPFVLKNPPELLQQRKNRKSLN